MEIDLKDIRFECCNKCKNPGIKEDDNGNVLCNVCHSLNEIEVLENFEQYVEKYGHIWNIK